jgi:hypothetical protein
MALPGNIESARTTAQSAASALGELTAGSYTIGDELKKRIDEAYDYNSDVVGPLDTATLGYVGAGTQALGKYGDPTSPDYIPGAGTRQAAVSGYIQSKALPMLTLGNILGTRFGRIDDLIGAGTRAYQANTARAQSNYEAQRQLYQDLLNEYQISQPEKQWINLGDRYALIDENGNIISEQPITDTSSGSGGEGSVFDFLTGGSEWVIDDEGETTAPASYAGAPSSTNPIPGFELQTTTQPQPTGDGGWNVFDTLRLIGNVTSLPGKIEETKTGIKQNVDTAKNIISGLGALKYLF